MYKWTLINAFANLLHNEGKHNTEDKRKKIVKFSGLAVHLLVQLFKTQ